MIVELTHQLEEVRSLRNHKESDHGPMSSFENPFKYKSKGDDVSIRMSIIEI
jgi:hypothetical protein